MCDRTNDVIPCASLDAVFRPNGLVRSQEPIMVCISMRGKAYSEVHEAPSNANATCASYKNQRSDHNNAGLFGMKRMRIGIEIAQNRHYIIDRIVNDKYIQ